MNSLFYRVNPLSGHRARTFWPLAMTELRASTRRSILLLAVMTLFTALFLSSQSAHAQTPPANTSTPDGLVRMISQGVLDEVKADRTLQSGDIDRLNALVERRVMPHINFTRMTALAVGRNWRSATPEQQQTLMKEFRLLLLLTYADAVRQVTDTTIQIRPLRARPDDDEVIVRTQVLRPGKEAIQLDYRLEKSPNGWKIFDLNILGLWLIENYRTQFNQIVTANGIDGLITSMQDKNRSLTKQAAAK
jgi:phospholipid transport system substrate-binding protein